MPDRDQHQILFFISEDRRVFYNYSELYTHIAPTVSALQIYLALTLLVVNRVQCRCRQLIMQSDPVLVWFVNTAQDFDGV